MMPTRRASRRRPLGLTLIELMIGIAIMAVLMSLAVPSVATVLQRQRLKAAALAMEVDLRDARFEAVRRGAPLHLAFVAGPEWCYAIATSPDCDCRIAQPCRIKAARSTDFNGVSLAQSRGMRFDPGTGQPDADGGALAVWQSAAGERVRVSVGSMGRPQVCVLDGHIAALPGC